MSEDNIVGGILPPFKEVKDKHGRIHLHLPLYITIDASTASYKESSGATMAYPAYICLSREQDEGVMIAGSTGFDGSTRVSAQLLYKAPIESPMRVYALPLDGLCRKASAMSRLDVVKEAEARGKGRLCVPGLSVANNSIYKPATKTILLYAFNVEGIEDCSRIDYVYYTRLQLKLENAQDSRKPPPAELHLVIASNGPIDEGPEPKIPSSLDLVVERGCVFRAAWREECPRLYRVTHGIWPPARMIKDGVRTGYVKANPLYLTLLASAQQGTGSVMEKLVGGSVEASPGGDLSSEVFYVPSSVFFSIRPGRGEQQELKVLANAVERVYSNVMVLSSDPLDYTSLYLALYNGILGAFSLLAHCAHNSIARLDDMLRDVIQTASELFGSAFKTRLPESRPLVDITRYRSMPAGETSLVDPKLLAKMLLNNASARAALQLASKGRDIAWTMSPVVFQKLIKIPYPVSALLPGARMVGAGRESQLAYTYILYNNARLALFSQLAVAASSIVDAECRLSSRLERDNLTVILAWLASAVLHYYRKHWDTGRTLAISIEPLARTGALIGALAGIHALSHMQMRHMASRFSTSRRRLREYIVMVAPSDAIAGLLDSVGAPGSDGIILEGGIEIWDAGSLRRDNKPRAWILTVDTREGSGYLHPRRRNQVPLGDTLRELELYTGLQGSDRCYTAWPSRLSRLKSRIDSYMNKLLESNREFAEIIDQAKNETLASFSINTPHTPVEHAFYMPVEIAQKVLEKRIHLLKEMHGVESDMHLSFLIGHITRSQAPDCFDACYNCIMDEYCFIKHSNLQRMLISKNAARLLAGL